MGKMKDLYTAGVTDVNSYLIGKSDEQERIIKLLPKDLRFWIGNRAYNKLIAHIKGENK